MIVNQKLLPFYQSLFDKTWKFLVIDHSPNSFVISDCGDIVCRYRIDLTSTCRIRCAIGNLIPDEKYNAEIEGKAVWYLLDNKQIEIEEYNQLIEVLTKSSEFAIEKRAFVGFIENLQSAHDTSVRKLQENSLPLRREALEEVAKDFELTIPA